MTQSPYDKYLSYTDGNTGGGSSPTTPQQGSNNVDAYQLAKDQEYGLLFDREVALENAKANALKYTQNQTNAQGFGGTGYGSSIQSGIYNTYMNKLGEAQNQTAENVANINLQQAQDEQQQANDRFQSVTTMLSQADSVDSMNGLLVDYGYGTVDENGDFQWGQKPDGMSDDDWYQMKYYYGLQKNALGGDTNAQWADRVFQVAGLQEKDGADYKGIVQSIANVNSIADVQGGEELKNFYMTANNGDIVQVNTTIANNGDTTLYAMYYNGKLYVIDSALLQGRQPKVTVNISRKKK